MKRYVQPTFIVALMVAGCSGNLTNKSEASRPVGSSVTAHIQAQYESVSAGTFVPASWSGVNNPAKDDWIGVFPEAGDDGSRVTFEMTGGAPSATMDIRLPAQVRPGKYELRLYSHGTWKLLTISKPFQIGPSKSHLAVRNTPVHAGDHVEIEWTGIQPPSKKDWIGLFPEGGADGTRVTFDFTGGPDAGSMKLSVPDTIKPGNYELRLYSNGGWQKLATSQTFEIRESIRTRS